MASKVVATAARPKPPNAGKGRVKGVPNKATVAVKTALQAVYADLQGEAGGDNAHLKTWAAANPTEFYKLWAKMLPTEVSGPDGGPVQTAVLMASLDKLSSAERETVRALSLKMAAA